MTRCAKKPAKRVVTRRKTKKTAATTPSNSERVKAWRAKNRERYNTAMRAYRAKLKAAEKEKK